MLQNRKVKVYVCVKQHEVCTENEQRPLCEEIYCKIIESVMSPS